MKTSLDSLANLNLLWVALAFLAGIVLAGQVVLPVRFWLALAGVGLLAGIILRLLLKNSVFLLAILPFFLFAGAARYQFAQPQITPESIAYYNDFPRTVWVTGSLTEPPDVRDTYQNLRVKVHTVDFGDGDIPISGLLLVRARYAEDLHYGNLVRIRGDILTPSENEVFSYRDYLSLSGIYSTMSASRVTPLPQAGETNPFWALMYRLKHSLSQRIYLLFPEPEASLLHGILLGDDDGMSPELQQSFKNTGTSHIIAISGFNIAIIAALLVAIFSRIFGKTIGSVLAIFGIAGYTLLVGAEPSVVRAAIMGILSIVALQVGRRTLALNALALVAAGMALYDPFVLQNVGFQLSFAATLGLVLYAQPLQDWAAARLRRFLPVSVVERVIGPFSDYFLLTLAAQATTLPVIAYHFQRISLSSIVVNPLILPAQPPVMILGGLAVLASHIYLPLGKLLVFFAWPFPAYTIRIVERLDFPQGVVTLGEFNLLFLLGIYGLMLALTFGGQPFRERAKKVLSPAAVLTTLAILAYLAWRLAFAVPDGRLHLTFLDVGSGDAILIQTTSGKHILINGGPSPSRLSDQIGRILPPFRRDLDYLLVAAPQENQMASLPTTLERFIPQSVLWAGDTMGSYSAQRVNEWVLERAIPYEQARTGTELDLGDGARLRVLDSSARGMIILVEWQVFRAILPLGVKFESFERLNYGREIGSPTVLLLSESGYAPANPPEWLLNLSPSLYVLSVAGDDPNGLPDSELVDLLSEKTVLRTDRNGRIDISTDGEQIWVEVERK